MAGLEQVLDISDMESTCGKDGSEMHNSALQDVLVVAQLRVVGMVVVGKFRFRSCLEHIGSPAKVSQDLYLILPGMMPIDPNYVGSGTLLFPKSPVRVPELSLGVFQDLDQWGLFTEIVTTYDAALKFLQNMGHTYTAAIGVITRVININLQHYPCARQ